MSDLLKEILSSIDLGYEVTFKSSLINGYVIECSKEDKDSTSILPADHINDDQIMKVIRFNRQRLQEDEG